MSNAKTPNRPKQLPLPEVPLANARHEMYAQNLSVGMEQAPAYIGAGFSQTGSGASRTANYPEVKQRIVWLQKSMAQNRHALIMHQANEIGDVDTITAIQELKITKTYLLAHLMHNVVLAQEVGQISASNKAIAMLWAVLEEGTTRDPDGRRNDNKLPDTTSIGMILDFAREMSQKPKVNIVAADDIGFTEDADLKDATE